jgi:hypothetical protein
MQEAANETGLRKNNTNVKPTALSNCLVIINYPINYKEETAKAPQLTYYAASHFFRSTYAVDHQI